MHGNVRQWGQDCKGDADWRGYAGAPTDGTASSEKCDNRVLRGGAWRDSPLILRSANRVWSKADGRFNYYGFRLARTLNP
jgi:formylglycine-generating enzyme required for sulfatase activity